MQVHNIHVHVHVPVDALSVMCTSVYSLHHGSSIEISYDERQRFCRNIRPALAMDLNWDWLWKSEMQEFFYAGLFYNGTTGQLTCFNTTEEFIECADPTGCGIGPDSLAWDYQVC